MFLAWLACTTNERQGAAMKTVLIPLSLLLLASSTPLTFAADEASPPKVCLNVRNIQRTETPDDRTILFHMRDGKVWQNRLRQNCPQLRYSPLPSSFTPIRFAPTSSSSMST
jgi:hypothetical protein